MAMDKTKTIIMFHNLLAQHVKSNCGDMTVEEHRVNNLTTLFRFKTEDPRLNYVLQVDVRTTKTAYNIDVTVIEEHVDDNSDVKPELIDSKLFTMADIGLQNNGVKTVFKYVKGMIKAIVLNEEPVFDEE